MNVHEELSEFILKEFAVDSDMNITADTDLLMQGIIDSMGIIKLVNFMEEKFGIKVGDIDMVPENFQNIDSLAEFIKSRQ
jgi:acyl carrier protein